MKYLLIDTAAEVGVAALMQDSEVLAEAIIPNSFQGSKILLPEMIALFEKTMFTPSQLDFVATGIGPGSYTGIRVAVISAKAFAYALHIPIVGVCSLEAYIPSEEGTFAIVSDAKIGGAYLLIGEKKGSALNLDQPQLTSIESIPQLVSGIQHLVTPFGNRLPQRLPTLSFVEQHPSALTLGQSAYRKFQKGDFPSDTHLEILYLRKTQAELEKEQKNGTTDGHR